MYTYIHTHTRTRSTAHHRIHYTEITNSILAVCNSSVKMVHSITTVLTLSSIIHVYLFYTPQNSDVQVYGLLCFFVSP